MRRPGAAGFIVHAKRHIVNHMQDWYALLRRHIADMMHAVLGVSQPAAQVDCPAGGEAFLQCGADTRLVAARCAAPLAHGADAEAWAGALWRQAENFPLGETPFLHEVHARGGHLLFVLDDAVFTLAARDALASLPPAAPGALWREDLPLARALYAKRRMWMLARKAQGAPFCPPYPAVQQGLLRSLALAEYPELARPSGRKLGKRALELRLLDAAEALLAMAYEAPPPARADLLQQSAHVADAAARLLELGIARIKVTQH